jgi:hypothetical protein
MFTPYEKAFRKKAGWGFMVKLPRERALLLMRLTPLRDRKSVV